MDARRLKAEALRKWGYEVTSINWRHNALISALELESEEALPGLSASAKSLFGAVDVIAAIPPGQVIENIQVQIKAEEVLDVQMTLGFSALTGSFFFNAKARGRNSWRVDSARSPSPEQREHLRCGGEGCAEEVEGGCQRHQWAVQRMGVHGSIATNADQTTIRQPAEDAVGPLRRALCVARPLAL
jgi:hypothetical protein